MEDNQRQILTFRFSDSREEAIYRRLLLMGPGPSAFFRDACHLKSSSSIINLKSTTHLIAHCLREIESAIGSVLSPLSENQAVKNEKGAHATRIKYAVTGLELSPAETSQLMSLWLSFAGEDNDNGLAKRAHRKNLDYPRESGDEFDAWWSSVLSLFDIILRSYEERYGRSMDYIDRLLAQSRISREKIAALKKSLPLNVTTYRYLFNKLTDPSWVKPLHEKGFFDNPFELFREDDSTQGYPWPQSEYLKRMAEQGDNNTNKQVLEIMQEVGRKTDNYFIHEDFTKAALAMSVDLAVLWAEFEIKWLRKGNKTHGFLEDDFGNLASKLANEGRSDVAVRFAEELLNVLPDPDAEKKSIPKNEAEEIAFSVLQPQIRCERYNYEEILKKNMPDLRNAAPFETLDLLCKLLEKAIIYSNAKGETGKPYDLTRIWRPAIESNNQNYSDMIDGPLITAVRDTAETICKENPSKIKDVVEKIESFGWNVFKRIGLYLLTVLNKPPMAMIKERLLCETAFDAPAFRHEYASLLKKYFDLLNAEQKKQIWCWINDARSLKEYYEKNETELTAEQKGTELRRWQYCKLATIKEHLKDNWKTKYESLHDEFPDKDVVAEDNGVFWRNKIGAESPKQFEELKIMPIPEQIEYLKAWKPTGRFGGATPVGLGRVLEALVAEDNNKYAEGIGLFLDENIDPTYIRHLISGFSLALENNKSLPYESVFTLCKWVVDQPRDILERVILAGLRDNLDIDLNWRNARSEIARLMERIFHDDMNFPFDLRDKAWAIIGHLTEDPEPTLDDEEKYGGDNMDPLTMSINYTRGKAMHAVVKYALWVYRNIQKRENREPGFDDKELKNVRKVLDEHLKVTNKKYGRSLTDRAVYGEMLPQLMRLDAEWFKKNIKKIFPSAPGNKNLREAAWSTYLIYSRLYDQVFEALKEIYEQEVKELVGKTIKEGKSRNAELRLVEQLVVLYAREEIDLNNGGMIDILFRTTPGELKVHAMEFMGRSLAAEGAPQSQVVSRFKALWEWREKSIGGLEQMPEKELSAFGWWFASGKCGDDWALPYLENVLSKTGIGRAHLPVFERMSDIFEKYPDKALRCLRLFIEKNDDPWFFRAGRQQKGVWTLLDQAVRSNNSDIRDEAGKIINILGSRGHLQYRELYNKLKGK